MWIVIRISLVSRPIRGPGTHCLRMCRKNNGHSPKSGEFVYLLRITSRSRGDLLAGKHSLASATPEETVDLWFGVFTSAQPPASECLLAFANFCPVLSRMRTQYPPGPILGLGSRLDPDSNLGPDACVNAAIYIPPKSEYLSI